MRHSYGTYSGPNGSVHAQSLSCAFLFWPLRFLVQGFFSRMACLPKMNMSCAGTGVATGEAKPRPVRPQRLSVVMICGLVAGETIEK